MCCCAIFGAGAEPGKKPDEVIGLPGELCGVILFRRAGWEVTLGFPRLPSGSMRSNGHDRSIPPPHFPWYSTTFPIPWGFRLIFALDCQIA